MANNNNAVGKLFKLDIDTPQKAAFSGEAESFTVPGSAGSFEVLYDHAPLLSTVTIGEVKVVDQTGSEWYYATTGGFVEVIKNKVTFLAETLEKKEEIDIARASAARKRAEERLEKKEPGTDVARARTALARAVNRLRVAGK